MESATPKDFRSSPLLYYRSYILCYAVQEVHSSCSKELRRLRRELDGLRKEKEILRRATAFTPERRSGAVSRFKCIDREKTCFPMFVLCKMVGISKSGYYTRRSKRSRRAQPSPRRAARSVRGAARPTATRACTTSYALWEYAATTGGSLA